jgi:hypothetical protein
METILETILTNAGFAGALLAVCGWALWKKDAQVKDLQAAAVAREKEVAAETKALTAEYIAKLGTIADARTSDAQRVTGTLMELQEKDTESTIMINTTLVGLKNVMTEIRADVRRRSTPSGTSMPPVGGV